MKKLMMILAVSMISLTACKKDEIKPNPPQEAPYENNEGETEEPEPHISDTMVRVNVLVIHKSSSVAIPKGVKITYKNKTVKAFSNSSNSEGIYLTTGSGDRNWNGWVKPGATVTVYGSLMGGNGISWFKTRIVKGEYANEKTHSVNKEAHEYEHSF